MAYVTICMYVCGCMRQNVLKSFSAHETAMQCREEKVVAVGTRRPRFLKFTSLVLQCFLNFGFPVKVGIPIL